jgi:rhodanese-related sulfurtransferase
MRSFVEMNCEILKSKKIVFVALLAMCILFAAGCNANDKKEVSNMEKNSYTQITQEQAKAMMLEKNGHIIIDVRTREEYDDEHIPGAICIPNESIDIDRPELLPDLNQIILVYCRSGKRSAQAAQKLADIGYTNVYEFGGIIEWTGDVVRNEAD